jgi:hypothetical protein
MSIIFSVKLLIIFDIFVSANAEYIKMADQYVPVPGGTNNNNYANVELIVDLAKRMHAQVRAHYPVLAFSAFLSVDDRQFSIIKLYSISLLCSGRVGRMGPRVRESQIA